MDGAWLLGYWFPPHICRLTPGTFSADPRPWLGAFGFCCGVECSDAASYQGVFETPSIHLLHIGCRLLLLLL